MSFPNLKYEFVIVNKVPVTMYRASVDWVVEGCEGFC